MAASTVIERKGDIQMTDAAEFTLQNVRHFKILGGFFFNIKDVRMAGGTVEPLVVRLVWKNGRRDPGPTRFESELLVEDHGLVCSRRQTRFRFEKVCIHGIDPIDAVAKSSPRQSVEPRKRRLTKRDRPVMAFLTMLPGVAKGGSAIMAGAAIQSLTVLLFGNFRGVDQHLEAEFQVTDPAGMARAMRPVGKPHRLHAVRRGGTVDQHISVLFRRRKRRKIPRIKSKNEAGPGARAQREQAAEKGGFEHQSSGHQWPSLV